MNPLGQSSPQKSSATPAKRPAHACERCRLRHQKCLSGPRPEKCANCEKADATCEFKSNTELQIRFSKIKGVQSKSSPPKTRRRANKSISRPSTAATSGSTTTSPDGQTSSKSPGRADLRRPSSGAFQLEDETMHGDFTIPGLSGVSELEPSPGMSSHHQDTSTSPHMSLPGPSSWEKDATLPWSDFSAATTVPMSELTSGQNGRDFWPLSEEEAELIKYFFSKLVSWFDYCDPEMRFRTYVGSNVLCDAATFYAVLAVSARHREATTSSPGEWRSDEYERKCFEILIPSLDNVTATLQESVLASAMLLRLLEEMTEPSEGEITSTHAVSAPMLLQIRKGNITASSLSDALLVIALRQEIYVANMLQRTFDDRIWMHCNVDDSLGPASDAVWTFRIIGHMGRVTNFVYGDMRKDTQRWDELWQYLLDWDRLKPISFRPLYHSGTAKGAGSRKDGESGIPKIYYAWDCPIGAQQYLQLCRVLLLAHDPRAPVLTLGRTSFLRQQEEKIRNAVRVICGIAICNQEYWPATSCASLSIAMCGELFSDPAETKQLLDILFRNEAHLGWPCLRVGRRLQDFWNSQRGC